MTTKTTTTLDFVGKKSRKPGEAYAVVIGANGWRYEILKRYANDDAKPYARWLVNVHGVAEEMGDTYVKDIVSLGATLVVVEGDPATDGQVQQFVALQEALSQQPGGILVF